MIEDEINIKILEENYNKYKDLFLKYSNKSYSFIYKDIYLFIYFPSFNSFQDYLESEEIQNSLENYELHVDYNEDENYKKDISDKLKEGQLFIFANDETFDYSIDINNNINIISYSEIEYYIDNIVSFDDFFNNLKEIK
jgi:hypothetical protein